MQEKFGVPVASHIGPVRSIERNYSFLKNYITAGDWTVRIWSEDCKESSIIWTSFYKCELIKALWSPVKPSVFFVARNDGVLDAWDLILDQNKPACTTQVYYNNFLDPQYQFMQFWLHWSSHSECLE
ncbi:hypothetical protein AAG570_008564 [Ranatra chinensis]|uniref:Uncharacterized protein n=1 Tax=Ranatra chinensis TaxID=642074 RepID=A0ABD0YRW3_9HEMI